MHENISALEDNATIEADVAIVGAGAVGFILGVVLARRSIKTVIFEYGSEIPTTQTSELTGETTGQAFDGLVNGRLKALGGTTNLWGGQLVPFSSLDFKARPWLGLDEWPVSFEEVSDYFSDAYALLNLSEAEQEDQAVWRQVGLEAPDLGGDFNFVFARWMKDPNFVRLFGNETRKNDNLRIYTNANVIDFNFDTEGKNCDSLIISNNGRKFVASSKMFILSNGTLEIPRLLLNTARQNKNLPWANNDWVGAGFSDHVHGVAGHIDVKNKKVFRNYFEIIRYNKTKYTPKIWLSHEFQTSNDTTNCVLTINPIKSIGARLEEVRMLWNNVKTVNGIGFLKSILRLGSMLKIMMPIILRYLKHKRIYYPMGSGLLLGIEIEQTLNKNSRIFLSSEADKDGIPRIGVHWEIGQPELVTARSAAMALKDAFQRLELADVTIEPKLLDLDPGFLDLCHNANHHMGGTRMAESRDGGVVDRNLRVFGSTNLYVAGAAAFPSGSFANPTFTAIALALRLADHVGNRIQKLG